MNYEVKTITYEECKEWFLYKHYAKRMPPISYAFGLFDGSKCIGVCSFGVPLSSKLRDSLKGNFNILELNRLVINDGLKSNSLSFFVSSCLKKLPKPFCIVSYADTSQNHHGYIYQATNFTYTGLSAKFKDYAVKGMEHLHGQTIMDMSRGQEDRVEWLRDKFGDNLYMKDRPRKHRYFYFLGSKKQVKKMRELLPYKVQPYPKGDNKRYDSSFKPNTQTKLF